MRIYLYITDNKNIYLQINSNENNYKINLSFNFQQNYAIMVRHK